MGRRHRPFFRINAIDSREPRDGKILEKLGHYDPIEKDKDKQLVLDLDRVRYWLGKGAVPSDTVSDIISRAGIKHKYADQKLARREKAKVAARAKGKPFDENARIAIKKAAEAAEAKIKADAEAKVKAEADAKAAAAAEKAKEEAEEKAKADAAAAEAKAAEPEAPAAEPEAETKEQ